MGGRGASSATGKASKAVVRYRRRGVVQRVRKWTGRPIQQRLF